MTDGSDYVGLSVYLPTRWWGPLAGVCSYCAGAYGVKDEGAALPATSR
jgi:hypothetical protein